jgi:DNA-binding NarL/FixJ family response regulator
VRAARYSFWLGFHLADRGDMAQATGWLGRASRLLDRAGLDCVERGLLLVPSAYQHLTGGDPDAAYSVAAEAVRIGERFENADLIALGVHLQGRARLLQRRVEEGLALLDESMVGVTTGELSPQITGLIYGSMIGACRTVYALDRAHEWTVALTDWCARQPDMVAYTGQCLVYRAEIMQLHGAWLDAIAEARRAGERSARGGNQEAAAAALYRQGELHRLLGEFAQAEKAYEGARRCGMEPQPGLALLRLAQGKGDAGAAVVALRDALRGWESLDAPYDAARVRVLLALACRALDDEETAALELRAARAVFEALAAAPELARLDALTRPDPGERPHGLTPRELEVLRLVATGMTNKAIAEKLFVSERTVDRHVSNMLMKLGVPSRAAATAFAYEHQLM